MSSTGPPAVNGASSNQEEFKAIQSTEQALALIHDLLGRQLGRSKNTAPNESIYGDDELKRAFWLLLGPLDQRTTFLKMCKNREFWPRIRSCIGSPPFSFLMASDNHILNPGGITVGRTNMTSETRISTSMEIGKGQFTDIHNRRYRWVHDDNTHSTQIPIFRIHGAKRIVLDVCNPKIRLEARRELMKRPRAGTTALHYPRPGDAIVLTPNPRFGGPVLRVTVRTVESRGTRSPVARLYASSV